MGSLSQIELFQIDHRPDGTVLLTPRRFAAVKDISAAVAEARFGIDRERLYVLAQAGSIDGWRHPGQRTKWWFDPLSIEAYKARRKMAARE